MKKVAFILIMIVRLTALISIALGIALWMGKHASITSNLVLGHFTAGFVTVSCVLGLGILALAMRIWPLGLLAVLFAVGVPATGFLQIPTIGPNLGGPQIGHMILILGAIGLAEATAGKIKRAE